MVLRFHYRGVNLSEGEYAHGEAEFEDARARPARSISELEPLVASLPEPKKLVLIEAEDHFFADALSELERQIAGP